MFLRIHMLYSSRTLFFFFGGRTSHISLFFSQFIYFWLCWVFIATHGLSLVGVSEGCSSLRCTGFSLLWPLLLQSTGSSCVGFCSLSTQAQKQWRTGPGALRHVESSWTRDQTHVLCIGRQTPMHCITREVPVHCIRVPGHTYKKSSFV